VRQVRLAPIVGEGTSIGVYEEQLGRRFLFGLADLPPLPRGGELQLVLRPDRPLPAMRVVDPDGAVVEREIRNGGDDRVAHANLPRMSEDELERYFDADADYHPINGYRIFESAPLVRRLRVGDLVEWCRDSDGAGPGRRLTRCRGEVVAIREIASAKLLDTMRSWVLEDYVFTLREKDSGVTYTRQGRNGSLRLSPRPWKDT
jgi:hypothetical protein